MCGTLHAGTLRSDGLAVPSAEDSIVPIPDNIVGMSFLREHETASTSHLAEAATFASGRVNLNAFSPRPYVTIDDGLAWIIHERLDEANARSFASHGRTVRLRSRFLFYNSSQLDTYLFVNICVRILSTFRTVRRTAFSLRSQRFPESVLSRSPAALRILGSSRRPSRSEDIRRFPEQKILVMPTFRNQEMPPVWRFKHLLLDHR